MDDSHDIQERVTALLRVHVFGGPSPGQSVRTTTRVSSGRSDRGSGGAFWAVVVVLFLVSFFGYLLVVQGRGITNDQLLPHVARTLGISKVGCDFTVKADSELPPRHVLIAAANQIWQVSGSDYDLVMRKLSAIEFRNGVNPDLELFYPDGYVILSPTWSQVADSKAAILVLAAHLVLMAKVLDGESEDQAIQEVKLNYGFLIPQEQQQFFLTSVGRFIQANDIIYWVGDGGVATSK